MTLSSPKSIEVHFQNTYSNENQPNIDEPKLLSTKKTEFSIRVYLYFFQKLLSHAVNFQGTLILRLLCSAVQFWTKTADRDNKLSSVARRRVILNLILIKKKQYFINFKFPFCNEKHEMKFNKLLNLLILHPLSQAAKAKETKGQNPYKAQSSELL